ncbi:Phosphoglycerate mutase-like protein AT74 [Glycine soja]
MHQAIPHKSSIPTGVCGMPHARGIKESNGVDPSNIATMVSKNMVIVIGKQECCMCHVVKRVEENEYDWCVVLSKRRIMMQHGKSQGNRDIVYTTAFDHNIQSTTEGMTQVICIGEHLYRVMGSDGCSSDMRMQFYVSSYAHTIDTPRNGVF